MKPEQLNVEDIFLAAADKPAGEERTAYLDQVCGDDNDLRSRVDRLLQAQSKVGSFLESPAPEFGATAGLPLITEQPGTVIGLYKLLEQIGEGGFGVVYLAEQTEPVRRQVALKVIKAGMDTKEVIARFGAERQALALMDHPNIAKVFDAGSQRHKAALGVAAGFIAMLAVLVAGIGWTLRDREVREQELAQKAERGLAQTEQNVRQSVERATKIRDELHEELTESGGVQKLLNQPGRWESLIHSARLELTQARQSAARAEGYLSAELTQKLHKLDEQLAGDEADRDLAQLLENIRMAKATWIEGSFDYLGAAEEYSRAFAEFDILNEDIAIVAAAMGSLPIKEQLVAAL